MSLLIFVHQIRIAWNFFMLVGDLHLIMEPKMGRIESVKIFGNSLHVIKEYMSKSGIADIRRIQHPSERNIHGVGSRYLVRPFQ